MTNVINEKEYNSVILAALLHDIGKLLNKVEKRKHPYFSADFAKNKDFEKLVSPWVDAELVATLCQRHHENPTFPEDLQVQRIKDPHTRALAYLVSRADNYQATERKDEEESEQDFKQTRLKSIFSRVNIERGEPIRKYYELTRLDPIEVFPREQDWISEGTGRYKNLIDTFGKAFKELKPSTFEHLYVGLLSLFEEHLWCVPSDLTKESDISLFDHLSISAAIAACLYLFHSPDFDEVKIKQDDVENFLLVAGDLSGIQNFIYEIASNNPRHLSKTLRGRSFYVALLCETVSLKYLRELNLPLSCRIISAGGQFILLVPKRKDAEEKVKEVTRRVEDWFYEKFLGRLTLNVLASVSLSGKDFSGRNFSAKLRELRQGLEKTKNQKLSTFLFADSDRVMEKAYTNLVESGAHGGHCKFCGVYPAVHVEEEGHKICELCNDSAKIGKKLAYSNYLIFGNFDNPDLRVLDIDIKLLDKVKRPEECFLIEKIGEDDSSDNPGFLRQWMANYIPRKDPQLLCEHDHKDEVISGCKALCTFCKSPCEVEERKNMTALSFQCLATYTLWKNGGGVDHLAVIKGDVDFLGLIFTKGLGENLTISRWSSLSRMLSLFFTGWIPAYLEKNNKPIYTVYAGGDDFLLIAPWEEGIEFAGNLQNRFRDFTSSNPNVTLSIGISLMRPKSPIRQSTKDADKGLENAKDTGRDRLSLFGTSVEWGLYKKLLDFKDDLDKKLNEKLNPNSFKTKLTMGFLYRLLRYHEMAMRYRKKGEIESLRYQSLMAYNTRRNIEDQGTKDMLLPLHYPGNEDWELMENLKIPLFWVLYKNRGRKELKEERP